MSRESAKPEELTPLELRKLRYLDVQEPTAPVRPAHLSAASGVVRRGDFVYVIGDDEVHLVVFRLSSSEPGRLRRVLSGELPEDLGERSGLKPVLEALTVLPPFEGHPYGALLGLEYRFGITSYLHAGLHRSTLDKVTETESLATA